MKNYAVSGLIMLNDIAYADGSEKTHLIGGGGLYALTGIKLWTDDCHFVGGIGKDFETLIAPWWDQNNIPRKGLNVCHDHCIYHKVEYMPDGRFEEHSLYDEGPRHDNYMLTHPEQFFEFGPELKGIYILGTPNPTELAKLDVLRKKYGTKIMLEVHTFYCRSLYLSALKESLPYLDMYSVNRPEAMDLFSVDTEEACIEKMLELGKPCFFRVGKKGSYMVMDGKAVFVPIVKGEHDVDPTGCGNSSTAAALYAYAEGYDPLKIAIIANVTSCFNAQQFGPIERLDGALREKALTLANKLYEEMK